jgi:HD-GYP domain-containing protein (c-di-GMP phosphodiesterase class II)
MSNSTFETREISDAEFVCVAVEDLKLPSPLKADIYLRLSPNRYAKRFRREDEFNSSDLETEFRRKGVEFFYLRKEDTAALFENQMLRLDALIQNASLDEKEARETAISNLKIISEAVHQIGFTPEVQALAKKSVALTLKAIGTSPNLSPILSRLKKSEGKYICSHSIMLAEISCALAHSIGWGSSSAFLKLALAAFLHDLPLEDNFLASMHALAEVKENDFSPEMVQVFRFHPVKAAEFARQFSGIPSDVETILVQHHELPDGDGFPRGLYHHQIAPLSAMFIIAHDLLNFFIGNVPTNDREQMLKIFLERNLAKYGEGTFCKIRESLETGVPLTAPTATKA